MKKWIESWLVPLVNRLADTRGKRRAVYVGLAVLGLLMAWLGISMTQVSVEQLIILDETPMGQGRLK